MIKIIALEAQIATEDDGVYCSKDCPYFFEGSCGTSSKGNNLSQRKSPAGVGYLRSLECRDSESAYEYLQKMKEAAMTFGEQIKINRSVFLQV